MTLSPRALALRLAIWTALLGWALWKMNATSTPAAPVQAADPTHTLARTPNLPVRTPATAALDPLALHDALGLARAEATRCGIGSGTIRATVGATGLLRAEVQGASDSQRACLAPAIWALPWPAGLGEMEEEMDLGGLPQR